LAIPTEEDVEEKEEDLSLLDLENPSEYDMNADPFKGMKKTLK